MAEGPRLNYIILLCKSSLFFSSLLLTPGPSSAVLAPSNFSLIPRDCTAMALLPSLHTTACFLVVCVASSTLAEYCRKAKLPLITGYILAGIVCGPCVLSLLSQPASAQLSELINDDAMGFIGFSAGSKFLLSELRGQMKPVLCLLTGLVGTTYLLVGCGVWFASPWLSLTSDATAEQRLAVALIVACLAVARSPSSAIALVSELDAHGALTTSHA